VDSRPSGVSGVLPGSTRHPTIITLPTWVVESSGVHSPLERTGVDLMQSGSDTPTKVIIFEASEMGCQLLAHELEQSSYGIKVVGCRSSSPEVDTDLLRMADVALISSGLKDGPLSGFNVLKSLRPYKETLRSIMLLDRDDPELVLEAFRWGASGVFERDRSCESLCKCIRRVHEGQVWANNHQVLYLIQAFGTEYPSSRKGDPLRPTLTKRELDIVRLVLEGKTNRDIATELNLSQHTVKNHLFRLFKKVGVSNRCELVASSFRLGMVAPSQRSA
jgi:DNA-binding NarL/FixJ family response regulator